MIQSRCYDCGETVTAQPEKLPPLCPKCGGVMSSDSRMFMVHDIVQDNGKSIRDNNMEKRHGVAIGSLVEVKYDKWHGGGACSKVHARLWVAAHSRDCDGTPLYMLAERKSDLTNATMTERIMAGAEGGFAEHSLTPIEATAHLADGLGALEWSDEERDSR